MYKFALDEKHIGYDDAPQFEYFDAIIDDDKIKRQVLTQKEWRHLLNYMIRQYSWHNPKDHGHTIDGESSIHALYHSELRNRMPSEGT